jgi:hypothetical protein
VNCGCKSDKTAMAELITNIKAANMLAKYIEANMKVTLNPKILSIRLGNL